MPPPGPPADRPPWPRRHERIEPGVPTPDGARSRHSGPDSPSQPAGRSRPASGHSDSRPTDIRSLRTGSTTARGSDDDARPDTAAQRRRYKAAESAVPPEERDRAARLSGEIPIVPKARTGGPAGPGPRPPGTDRGTPGSGRARPGSGGAGTRTSGDRPRGATGGVESTTVRASSRSGRPGPTTRKIAGTKPAPAGAAATSDSARKRSDADDESGSTGTPSTGRSGPVDTARRTLAAALGLTAASTALPGTGHLAMRRRRTGGLILGTLLVIVVTAVVLALVLRRSTLLTNLLNTTTISVLAAVLIVAGIAWIAVVARTYALARPRHMPLGKKIVGTGTAAVLCLAVAVPFGYAVDLLNSQRSLLNSLFQGGGGTDAATALGKPRLNVLLLGSDAGPDRTGTRTDTMMVASIDTRSGRTTLFSLPRNIQRAEFPPGSPMAAQFPRGFHDPSQPLSGDFLLNAVYAYGETHPQVAPTGPTRFAGVNLLQQSISYMTGLPLDYYLEINMAGFSSMIDAVGGVTVNVGPEPIPVGGVTAFGRHVAPDRYIQPGVQTLNGEDALWFARSRRNGTDYQRMGRQRCLIQAVINEKSPADLLTRFQSIAAATKDTIYTDMPQQVLPALGVLADDGFRLESVAFDPTLPDPDGPNGTFDTADPDVPYMQQVVQKAITEPPPPSAPPAAPGTGTPTPSTSAAPSTSASPTSQAPAPSAAPQSVQDACANATSGAAPGSAGEGGQAGTIGADGELQAAPDPRRTVN